MELLTRNETAGIANDLAKLRKYLLTVYLEVGKDIDETLDKLSRQLTKLDLPVEGLDVSALNRKIFARIMKEAGIADLRYQLKEQMQGESSADEIMKLSQIMFLLEWDQNADLRQCLMNLEEAVRLLKSA